MNPESDVGPRATGTGVLFAGIVLFVVIGGPLVYYLWSVVNEILTGHFDATRALLAVPVLLVFVVLLKFLSHAIRRWDAQSQAHSTPTRDREAR